MSKLPDLEAWAIFAKVAELRSFSAAAEALALSKATVSKAVTRLEERLGAQLFHRTSRRLSLTATGQAVAGRAGALLSDAEAAEEAAREAAASPRGLVRITAPMSFGLAHVAPAIPELLAACPELAIDLHLSDAHVDLVAEGFDLALRIAALPDSSLRARRLADVTTYVVGSPSYFAAYGRPAHPSELSGHRCFAYSYLPQPGRWPFLGPAGEEFTVQPGPPPLRCNNGDALRASLCAGLGLARLPDFIVADDLDAGRLEIVLPEWRHPRPIALHLVTPPGQLRPARISAAINFFTQRFASGIKPVR
jgi:DNA-binding transcriptional LysR family regulator